MLDAAGVSHCIQEGILYVPLHDKAVKAFLRLNVANHVASMLDGCDTARRRRHRAQARRADHQLSGE